MKPKVGIWIVAAFLCLAGCGGGGGNGGGSAKTGVRILHAAIESAPVEAVLLSDKEPLLLQTARFAQGAAYVALPTGLQNIALRLSLQPEEAVGNASFEVAKNERRSLLIVGGIRSLPREVRVLLDAQTEPADGMAALRIVHGVAGALAVSADVGGQRIASEIPYGTAAEPVALASGSQRISVRRVADGKLLRAVSIPLEAGKSYTLLAAGEADYFVTLSLIAE